MSTLNTTNLKNPSSGSNNVVLNADGSTTISTLSATTLTATTVQGVIKQGTAVASTSGTSIDFTDIPSWVKRITVMFEGVSLSGTSSILVQLGDSGGVETTGYLSYAGNRSVDSSSTAGFFASYHGAPSAAWLWHGLMTITNISSNTWVQSAVTAGTASSPIFSAGSKALSGTLDRVRITTVNGTDTFDAGSVNILYEG